MLNTSACLRRYSAASIIRTKRKGVCARMANKKNEGRMDQAKGKARERMGKATGNER